MDACSSEFSQEVFEDLIEKEKNGRWLDENFKSLQIEHGDMFVAIYRASAIDFAETFDELVKRIEEKGIERLSQIVIKYIPEEDLIFIL